MKQRGVRGHLITSQGSLNHWCYSVAEELAVEAFFYLGKYASVWSARSSDPNKVVDSRTFPVKFHTSNSNQCSTSLSCECLRMNLIFYNHSFIFFNINHILLFFQIFMNHNSSIFSTIENDIYNVFRKRDKKIYKSNLLSGYNKT